jgi:hypothetical protein
MIDILAPLSQTQRRTGEMLAHPPGPDHHRQQETIMTDFPIQADFALATPKSQWLAALANFELTRADVLALPEDHSDEEVNFLVGINTPTIECLLDLPAPDYSAVATKMRILIAESLTHGFCGWRGEDIMQMLLDDVERLEASKVR